jgi:copper chaperone CopZ
LKETRGVIHAQVTFSNRLAMVAIDTNKISTTKLTRVIQKSGYQATPVQP